jgi:hypothetical protein
VPKWDAPVAVALYPDDLGQRLALHRRQIKYNSAQRTSTVLCKRWLGYIYNLQIPIKLGRVYFETLFLYSKFLLTDELANSPIIGSAKEVMIAINFSGRGFQRLNSDTDR